MDATHLTYGFHIASSKRYCFLHTYVHPVCEAWSGQRHHYKDTPLTFCPGSFSHRSSHVVHALYEVYTWIALLATLAPWPCLVHGQGTHVRHTLIHNCYYHKLLNIKSLYESLITQQVMITHLYFLATWYKLSVPPSHASWVLADRKRNTSSTTPVHLSGKSNLTTCSNNTHNWDLMKW